MKKIAKSFIPYIVAILAALTCTYKIVFSSTKTIKMSVCAILIILLLKLLYEVLTNYSEDKAFASRQKNIIKEYGFILSFLEALPNLKEYAYYKYDNMVDLIAKAMDSRVNIYYIFDENTCDFFLIDQGNLYVYTIKKDPKYFSRIDKYFVEAQHK